jgi:hypothetical protein
MVKPICRKSEMSQELMNLNKTFMEAYSPVSRESYVYVMEGDANRDRIRSSFAKLTGINFTDARCKKLSW